MISEPRDRLADLRSGIDAAAPQRDSAARRYSRPFSSGPSGRGHWCSGRGRRHGSALIPRWPHLPLTIAATGRRLALLARLRLLEQHAPPRTSRPVSSARSSRSITSTGSCRGTRRSRSAPVRSDRYSRSSVRTSGDGSSGERLNTRAGALPPVAAKHQPAAARSRCWRRSSG